MPPVKSNISVLFLSTVILVSVDAVLAVEAIANYEGKQLVIKRITSLPDGGILNLTFKSKIDGSLQPLLVKVPKGYTPKESWPLLVTLHGMGDGPILATEVESMVQIGPYGRGSVWFTGIGEKDVFECIEMAKKIFSIDQTRIYLCGFSMGATATFNLGFKYPDVWAACVPVCGRCEDMDMIESGRNLPFWINTGKLDMLLPPQCSRIAYDKARKLGFSEWKYTEYEKMGHSFSIDWKQIEKWLLTKKRNANPKQVSLCTKDLNRAYWVEVTEIPEYGKVARIDAAIEGQKIDIKTVNVSNYALTLNNNLADLSKKIQIVENGVSIFDGFLKEDSCFVKTRRNDDDIFKCPGLSGPLWDIYSRSSILVYGTNSKDESLIKAAKSCSESFANSGWMNKVQFRILPDRAITKIDIAENNLVLFGNAQTNKVLFEISDKLPIRMNGDRITVRSVEYSGNDIGYVLIYPNPANREKYVAIFSGNTADAIDCFYKIWPQLNSVPKSIDFGIFEFVSGSDTVKWRLKGTFGTNWDWQYSRPDRDSVVECW